MNFGFKRYFLLFFLIIICGYLLYLANEEIENKTIDQINNEQIVHATQAEENLKSFFNNFNSSLSFLAVNSHIMTLDPWGKGMMQDYYLTHQGDISTISRVDEHGIILYSYPNESISGSDISRQDHVAKMLATHKPVLSDAFTAIQGYRSVAMHIPVFSGNDFKGSIALLVPFDILAQKSLENIRVMDSGYAYAVSNGGIVLYSPYPGQTDKSVASIFNHSPSALAFLESARSGREGTGTYLFDPQGSAGGTPLKYHAISHPVSIGDQSWTIVVATPEKEIFSTLQTFTRDLTVVSFVILVLLLIFVYYSARAWGIVREEEKRRIVESALRESEKNYRLIFDSIQDVFYRCDKPGNLVMISPSGVSLFGYDTPEELVGKNFAETVYANPEEHERLLEFLEKNGTVQNYELVFRTKNGGFMYGKTSSHLYYHENGDIAGIEGIIHDCTSEKMTHNALQQALKKLNLLNSITFNDIQTHLFCLSGYLALSMSQITDPALRETVEKEEGITRSIQNSLNFAKDYQGLGIKPPAWQNVAEVFLYGISHTDLSRYTRTLEVSHIEVFADPLLEKVFFILADNLVRHSKKATEIRLVSRKINADLIISCEDNGVGIPVQEKEKIFERHEGQSKGNGLFLAREILGITSISIHETGTVGEGARFEILVPEGSFRFTHTVDPAE